MLRTAKILSLLSLALATIFFLGIGRSTHSSAGLCWLLDSPQREYLSEAGASFIAELCNAPLGALTPHRSSAPRSVLNSVHNSALSSVLHAQTSTNITVNNPNTDTPENTTQSETTVAVFGETVLVGFVDTGQALPLEPGISSRSGLARSADQGESFIDLGKAPPNPRAIGISDPSLAVDSKGNFYLSTIQQVPNGRNSESYMGVSRSTDDGQTFSPALLVAGFGPVDSALQDKELIAVDHTGSTFDGNLYMTWTEFDTGGSHILFVRSTDGAQTFSKPSILSDGRTSVQGATPAVGPDGEVYIIWINFGQRPDLRIRRSLDGGQTFEPERVVASLRLSSDPTSSNACGRRALKGNIRHLELPSVAVDLGKSPTRGTIYVTYSSDPDGNAGPDASDVYIVRSSDGGQSWSEAIRLNDDSTTSDQFQPAAAVARDGTVGVIFYDRRLDPTNLNIDLYMTRSTDGGQTWEVNTRVTDRSFSVPPIALNGRNFDNLRSICYMGDYNQMAADDEFFYLVWGDNRETLFTDRFPAPNGRPDPNVFFAKIPVHNGTLSASPTGLRHAP